MYNVTLGKRDGDTRVIAVDWSKLPEAAREKIIAYGVQRTFNDAVGGSDLTIDDKVKAVEKMLEAYYAGDIGRKRAEGVSAETAIARSLIRAAIKAKYGAKSPQWAAFTGLSDDAQAAKLDALYVEHEKTFKPQVDAEMKVRASRGKINVELSL